MPKKQTTKFTAKLTVKPLPTKVKPAAKAAATKAQAPPAKAPPAKKGRGKQKDKEPDPVEEQVPAEEEPKKKKKSRYMNCKFFVAADHAKTVYTNSETVCFFTTHLCYYNTSHSFHIKEILFA